MRKLFVAILAIAVIGCGDDDSDNTANNDANSTENNNTENTGYWTAIIGTDVLSGLRVTTTVDATADLLKIELLEGTGSLSSVTFEIPGADLDSTGSFSVTANNIVVTVNNLETTCTPAAEFTIELDEVGGPGETVGSYRGTVECLDSTELTINGAFGPR